MVAFRRKGWGFGVALAAALMLILQTAAASLALGQGTPPLDIFGNPLCITTSTEHTAPAKGEHPSLPECCTLGCSMFSSVLASPSTGIALLAEHRREAPVVFRAARLDPSTAPEYDPGNPRAPPLAA